ncbi:hypothetical protein BDW59DRAFT_163576 [Aspergillus cavernicola]|uniref:Uncharacterized protein n=1 Tax=Aspergillus cavernicola TaxID=176166 RepID=A0ABR4I799_9EURO
MLTADCFEEFCAQMLDTEFVYIPQLGADDRLVTPFDCIWDGDVSGTKHVLASHDAYAQSPKAKQFFQTVLSSHGAEWITKLSLLRTKPEVSPNSVSDVYKTIMAVSEDDDCWTLIRDGFEDDELIYIPHEDIWCPQSLCVWSACSFIAGRFGIRRHYPDLRYLFVDRLDVPQPDIPSYIEKMLLMAGGPVNRSELLVIMEELNGLEPTADDLELLKLVKFLPVQRKNTSISYVTAGEPFLIIDDTRLRLDPEVPVLDLTPEDACRLRHFFTNLGLGMHYVSGQIRQETLCVFNGAVESVELTHDLRQRAKALYRCTLYYGGMKSMLPSDKVHRLFSQAVVFTATGFRRHISTNDGLATEDSHEGRLHHKEIDGALRLYVPGDRKEQAICYATEIPHALVRYLKIDHQAACSTFATILRESPDILDEILGEKGIIHSAIKLSNELPVRTKSQLGPEGVGKNSGSSSGTTQGPDRSASIKLKTSKQYLEKQDNGLRYMTTLIKKYSITPAELGENDSLGIVSEYFKVKHEDRELTVTGAALKAAKESPESDQMALLLNDLDTQRQAVIISQSVLEAAAENEICGH